MNFSRQPNNLSPVQLLLQNLKQQEIKTEIDQQYKMLASQMTKEATKSISDLNKKRQEQSDPTLLQKLVNQGLATVKPDTQKKPKVSNKKGRKKLEDEISDSQYFKLSTDKQFEYDRKMATEYKKKGLGPYRNPFMRKKPVVINKPIRQKPIKIVDFGPKDKRQVL